MVLFSWVREGFLHDIEGNGEPMCDRIRETVKNVKEQQAYATISQKTYFAP